MINFKTIRDKVPLFLMGFLQVFLVVANTYFIAYKAIIGVALLAFSINYLWTHNVTRIAFGQESDRWIYSIGATLGSVSGFYSAAKLVDFLNRII